MESWNLYEGICIFWCYCYLSLFKWKHSNVELVFHGEFRRDCRKVFIYLCSRFLPMYNEEFFKKVLNGKIVPCSALYSLLYGDLLAHLLTLLVPSIVAPALHDNSETRFILKKFHFINFCWLLLTNSQWLFINQKYFNTKNLAEVFCIQLSLFFSLSLTVFHLCIIVMEFVKIIAFPGKKSPTGSCLKAIDYWAEWDCNNAKITKCHMNAQLRHPAEREWEIEKQTFMGSLFKWPQWAEVGQNPGRRKELGASLGFPKNFDHLCCFPTHTVRKLH